MWKLGTGMGGTNLLLLYVFSLLILNRCMLYVFLDNIALVITNISKFKTDLYFGLVSGIIDDGDDCQRSLDRVCSFGPFLNKCNTSFVGVFQYNVELCIIFIWMCIWLPSATGRYYASSTISFPVWKRDRSG